MDVYHKLKKLDQSQLSNIYYKLNNKKINKDITRSRLIHLILKPLKPKYKMETDTEKKDKFFEFKEGQKVEFLKSKSFTGHIGIKITKSSKNPKNPKKRIRQPEQKSIIFGFYPKNGAIYKSLAVAQKGEIWTPDPFLKEGNYETFYNTKLNKDQADELDEIINNKNCKLHEGTTGLRLECPTTSYYTMIPMGFKNQYNCRTYVTTLFPELKNKIPPLVIDYLGNKLSVLKTI